MSCSKRISSEFLLKDIFFDKSGFEKHARKECKRITLVHKFFFDKSGFEFYFLQKIVSAQKLFSIETILRKVNFKPDLSKKNL